MATHPLGQTLIVKAGCGWAQREGGRIEEDPARSDVVGSRPARKHATGATPATAGGRVRTSELPQRIFFFFLRRLSVETQRQFTR